MSFLLLPCGQALHPRVPPLLLRSPWTRWGCQEGRFAGFLPKCQERSGMGGVLCFPAAAFREAGCSGRSPGIIAEPSLACLALPYRRESCCTPELQGPRCGRVMRAQTEAGSFYKPVVLSTVLMVSYCLLLNVCCASLAADA